MRQHDELDASVRELAERRGGKVSLPDPPANTRSTVRMEGQSVTIEIPPGGMQPIHYIIPAVMLLPMIGFAIMITMMVDAIPLPIRLTILAVMVAVPLIFVTVFIRAKAFRRWHVEVSRDEITVKPSGLGARAQTIAADDVEEVRIAQRPGGNSEGLHVIHHLLGAHNPITVISDTDTITFGRPLEADEAEYIRALVTAVLSAPN